MSNPPFVKNQFRRATGGVGHERAMAKSKPAWFFAYVAATLDFFCGLRAVRDQGIRELRHNSRHKKLEATSDGGLFFVFANRSWLRR